ncbi:AraC family transcriptional regulator [Sedimentitalea nanhaiensis]|nr:AraC family transcriptional regulator [Sedimentitalea nanhaiensis]
MSGQRSPGSLRILCEAAPDYGVTAEACLAGTGLVAFDLYSEHTHVPLEQELRAIGNFLRLAPYRPGLGVEIGRRFRPEVFGIWGYAIQSSPTFRACLRTARAFANLSFIIAPLDLDERGDPPRLIFDIGKLPTGLKGFVLERQLTIVAGFSTWLMPDFPLSKLTLQTTLNTPELAAAIEKMLGIAVTLDCARDALELPGALMDEPLPRHDPAVMEQCLRQCRQLLKQEDSGDLYWTSRVREAALTGIEGDHTVGSVATRLGMTERTLRRRLSDEGTSFRKILLESRLAIGHELLKTAGMDVSSVAWRIGYSEPSSFIRAFTKEFGCSPGSMKQRVSGAR